MDSPDKVDHRVEWIDTLPEFLRIGPEWDALFQCVKGATVFQSHEWISAAYASFPQRRPCVCVIWRGSDLIGALPLDLGWERYVGLPLRTGRIAGYPRTDRHVFLACDAQTVGHLLEAAMGLPIDMLLLAETLDCHELSAAARKWLADQGCCAISRRASVARSVPLSAETSDDLYRSYGTKHRANVRRSRRLLDDLGQLKIEVVRPAAQDVPAFLDRLKAIEDTAWQGLQGTGLFSSGPTVAFYENTFRALAATGDVWAGIMTLDGEDVMYILGMTHGQRFYWYGTAYRENRIKGSAFHVLAHDLMITLRQAGVDCFDSSRNVPDRENALDRLNPQMVEHRHLALFRPTPLAAVHRHLLLRALPVYRRLRATVSATARGKPIRQWRFEPDRS